MQVLDHVARNEIGQANETCFTLVEDTNLHLLFHVKCYIILGGLADIPSVAAMHFEDAEWAFEKLWENRDEGEDEEIVEHGTMITTGLIRSLRYTGDQESFQHQGMVRNG